MESAHVSNANLLCKACGLCCSGHLFAWVKLRSAELTPAQALGLPVLGADPKQRGFNQPCPLWNGECTIYTSPHYPRACKTYQCKLLKKVMDESIPLPVALTVVGQAKEMIREVESLLPASTHCNFRERLVAYLGWKDAELPIKQKIMQLLAFYKDFFGVKDLIDQFEEIESF